MSTEETQDANNMSKILRAKQRRMRKKARKKKIKERLREQEQKIKEAQTKAAGEEEIKDVAIEWVSDRSIQHEELATEYIKTFEHFISAELLTMDPAKRATLEEEQARQEELYGWGEPKDEEEQDEKPEEGEDSKKPLSNKQKKKLHRLKIAELKRLVDRPEIVEEHDANAADPRLLIYLKSVRNSIPVPVHWCDTKKYLQGKRGFEKPPFALPPFIAATGITQIRDKQLQLGQDAKSKAKQRNRMRPKRGGLGIDYQVLHDAFFRHQTKPKNMTNFGDLYYEGKEFEQKFRKFKPGVVSDALKKALNMQCRYRVVAQQGVAVQTLNEEGDWRDVTILQYNTLVDWEEDNKDGDRIKISHPAKGWILKQHPQNKQSLVQRLNVDSPPPWLISMQRFGPPPAYPEVQIPGLNAPIPPWCKYGFADGQWGKPPVDRTGRPLYGDPFGIWQPEEVYQAMMAHDVELWAHVEDIESSDEDEASDSDEDETSAPSTTQISDTISDTDGMTSSIGDGTTSVVSSISAVESEQSTINLRKGGVETSESVDTARSSQQLYMTLDRQKASGQQGIFQTSHTYNIPGAKPKAGGVQVALNPENLEGMTEQQLSKAYEQERKRQRRQDAPDEDERGSNKRQRTSRFGPGRSEYDVRF